jgi:hypothetical protein
MRQCDSGEDLIPRREGKATREAALELSHPLGRPPNREAFEATLALFGAGSGATLFADFMDSIEAESPAHPQASSPLAGSGARFFLIERTSSG